MHDYVIVGGGSAGCVLAARLSEDPAVRVLLLEAGGEPKEGKEAAPPVSFNKPFQTTRDWNYTTMRQAHLLERRLCWPQAAMLDGRSTLNDLVALRGHPADYDSWAAAGCVGWSYAEILPYFKRLENNQRGVSRYHGADGPLHVADLTEPHPLTQTLVHAALAAGLPYNADFSVGRLLDGVGMHQVALKGRRHSAVAAYLQPTRRRPNLTVIPDAHVRHIDILNGRATGVTYVEDGIEWSAEAEAEVILCAGAVGSPQLLMLSGVGPAQVLEACGIGVRLDLPGVGQNLQDHLSVPVIQSIGGGSTRAEIDSWGSIARHLFTGGGPPASPVTEASIFVRTCKGLPAPDVQMLAAPIPLRPHAPDDPEAEAFILAITLLQPESSGYLALDPDDPAGPPLIQPRYLSDPDGADLNAFVTAIRRARDIFAQRPFRRYRSKELLPGAHKTADAELCSHVRLEAETLYHPAGTCAMGTGPDAVVDPALRVHGIEGLRVADASIMPTLPRGNLLLPTIMIGEKASDLIRHPASLPAAETA